MSEFDFSDLVFLGQSNLFLGPSFWVISEWNSIGPVSQILSDFVSGSVRLQIGLVPVNYFFHANSDQGVFRLMDYY